MFPHFRLITLFQTFTQGLDTIYNANLSQY